jgi:membrane protein implicated in regulation of membrane protease activity
MKRGIFAWVLLAGFVLLILNLIVFRVYWQLSMVIYLIVMFAFLFTNGRFNAMNRQDEPHFDDGEKNEDGEFEGGRGEAEGSQAEAEDRNEGNGGKKQQ